MAKPVTKLRAVRAIAATSRKPEAETSAKILLFDIETAPNVSYVWGHYEQNVIAHQEEWYMLSFAYKWLGDKDVTVKSLPDYRGYKPNTPCDQLLVQDLWKLFDEADIIIAHNGDAFDIKKANTRFIYHGLTPPTPSKTVDTLKLAKKYFAFNSNRLDDLGNRLGVGRKMPNAGFSLWKGCMSGNSSDWDVMCRYNKQDVTLLEKVYFKLRSWHGTRHPDVSVLAGHKGCPVCGETEATKRGFSYTATTQAQRYQCTDCGSYYLGSRTKNTGPAIVAPIRPVRRPIAGKRRAKKVTKRRVA